MQPTTQNRGRECHTWHGNPNMKLGGRNHCRPTFCSCVWTVNILVMFWKPLIVHHLCVFNRHEIITLSQFLVVKNHKCVCVYRWFRFNGKQGGGFASKGWEGGCVQWGTGNQTLLVGNEALFWVNYNDLTATSLEIMVGKGNYHHMTLIHASEIF